MTDVTNAFFRGIKLARRQFCGSARHGLMGNRTAMVKPGNPGHDKVKVQLTMMNSSVTVSAELGLSLVVPEHGCVPLVASLFYSADDPYAIRMAFHVGTDEPVEWIFARDLLAVGLEGPAGEGDVQVWPADEDEHELLNIALSSPFGEAHFEAPRASTAAFLARTYEVIPAGHETDYVDVDAELDELLWRA